MLHTNRKAQRRAGIAAAALGAMLFALPAGAQITHTMNFDTDAGGNAIADGTALTTQYAAWGVAFESSPAGGLYNPVSNNYFATDTTLTMTSTDVGLSYDPAYGNVLHAYGFTYPGWLEESGDPNFGIKFANPVTDFSLDLLDEKDGLSTLYVYDTNGDFRETVASPGTGGTETLSLAPAGYSIGAVIVAPGWTGDYVAVDNIRFTAVPEPGSVALLVGMSLAGAGFLHRRKAHTR